MEINKKVQEETLIRVIKDGLDNLEKEAHGEQKHGNKEMPPNIFHFKNCFKKIYNAVYELNEIEEQEYIPLGYINSIYDVEREVEDLLNYYIEAKKPFSEISEKCYLKILGNLSCVIKQKGDNRSTY
jgi:hypothetical protein